MRALIAVLICIVLFPAATSPDRPSPPTVSADTVTIREVRRESAIGPVTEHAHSRTMLLVERPVDARDGATSGIFVVDDDRGLLRRVAVTFGRSSSPLIEVVSGVSSGDRIVVSDMRAWDAFHTIQLRLP